MTDQQPSQGQYPVQPYQHAPQVPVQQPYQQPTYQQALPPQQQYGYQQQQYGYQALGYVPVVQIKNGYATAALVLGIVGFILTPIPLFIGLVVGGIPDILAIIFAIVALNKAPRMHNVGKTPAIFGLVLGGLGFISIFLGAGTIW